MWNSHNSRSLSKAPPNHTRGHRHTSGPRPKAMPQTKQRLFIQTIPSVPLFGMSSIPTALYYLPNQAPLIGFCAEKAAEDPLDVNRDFKVDLGHHKPSSTANRQ